MLASSLAVVRRHIFQIIYDREMLRAYALALAAGYAVARLSTLGRQSIIIGEVDRPALLLEILPHILVVQRKILRDRYPHRAALHAIRASCTRDGYLRVDDIGNLEAGLLLFLSQRLEVSHK